MRARLIVAGAMVVLLSCAAGCSDDPTDPAPTRAAALPDDLCTLVPAAFITRWGVARTGGSTDNGRDLSTATCSMAGEREGAPVTLEVVVTAYGDSADGSAAGRSETAAASACGELQATTTLQFSSLAAGSCNASSAAGAPAPDTSRYLLQVSGADALLSVDLSWDTPSNLRAGNDAVGLTSDLRDEIRSAALVERGES